MADVATSRPSDFQQGKHHTHNDFSEDLQEMSPESGNAMLPKSIGDDQIDAQSNGVSNKSEAVDPVGSVDGEGNIVAKDGTILGKVEDEAPAGSVVNAQGTVINDEGGLVEKTESALSGVEGNAADVTGGATRVSRL